MQAGYHGHAQTCRGARPWGWTAINQYSLIAKKVGMDGAPFRLVWLYMPL
jgi:hypothetical protein